MAKRKFYIVRPREDDRIVAVGSTEECARAMNMSISTFRTTVSRNRKGLAHKYEIDIEEEDEEPC
jgi:DNA-binding CsgD family transcriptional regulator